MNKAITLIFLLIPLMMQAQHAKGTFGKKDFVLQGSMEIVMKDGTKVLHSGEISGTDIKGTKIEYNEVDYIRLVKADFEYYTGAKYKYVPIGKNKVRLVLVIGEFDGLSLYMGRPTLTDKTKPGEGTNHYLKVTQYMMRKDNIIAKPFKFGEKWKNIPKLFSDCPRLLQYQKDEEFREKILKRNTEVHLHVLSYLYQKGCTESSNEEMKKDKDVISKMYADYDKLNLNNGLLTKE